MTIPGVEIASAALLSALAESAIRGLLLALVVGSALALFRVRRTAWRLSAWTVVLFAALAMPGLGRVVPAWSVPMTNVPALAWLQPAAPTAPPDAARVAIEQPAATSSRISTTDLRSPDTSATRSVVDDSTSLRASSTAKQLPSLAVVLVGLYLVGVLTLSVRAAMGWLATRRLERAAQPIDDADVLAQLARISASAGCPHAPRLAQSDRLHVPVTVSVARPMVILPDTWRTWDGAMIEVVLAHEVAHVARRDALTQRAALLYRAIFWFNPLAWWLRRHLTDLAEQASDEAVLSAGTSQTYYARVLLEFFRALPQPGYRANWHVAMARGAAANAEARVDRILAWKGGQAMRLTKSMVMSVVLAALPVVALTAAVRPAPAVPDQQAPVVPAQPALALSQPVPAPAQPVPVSTALPPAPSPAAVAITVVHTPSVPTGTAANAPDTPQPPVDAPPQAQAFDTGFYRPGTNGVSWPKLVRESKPAYTDEARDAGIKGTVELEVIVLPDGTVGPVRIMKSLDWRYGLDSEAVRAARQWVFEPAQLAGQPVAAVVTLMLEFVPPDPSAAPKSGVTAARPRPLADAFATGAYFAMGSAMVAPQPVGDRGKVNVEVSVRPDGTAGNAYYFGLTAPKIIQQAMPKYTPDAMRAKLQGEVEVEAIVMPDGTVGKVRVVRSLDKVSGLDEAAIVAAKQSTFTPTILDGKAVPVLVTMTLSFRLH